MGGLTLLASLALTGRGVGAHEPPSAPFDDVPPFPSEALASITTEEAEAAVRHLASPALEGRDTPSAGLDLAFAHVAECFTAAGLKPAPGATELLRTYSLERLLYDRVVLHTPLAEACLLEVREEKGRGGEPETPRSLRYGVDFVPLAEYAGEAEGELIFAGFGIENSDARYDDFKGLELRGKIVAIVAGEPEHKRLFEGPEVTAEAAVWNKLDALAQRGAAGALVIRRPPVLEKGQDAPSLAYRWTRATWIAPTNDKVRQTVPTLELHWDAARELLGFDPLDWAEKVDRTGKPQKRAVPRRQVRLVSATRTGPVALPNLVAHLPGSDASLAGEYVVVGAHGDHIGVGPRERVGRGADDNASGVAALMEVAEALALARPARSVLFVCFSGEEDGLLGSAAFVRDLPVPREKVIAMVNLDMIGRGDANHVVALGFPQNPALRDAVQAAQRLGRTGVSKVEECTDAGLFKRSDHYSFHEAGVPSVFFFENYPLEQNRDYHTWRDTPEFVNFEKVRNTARLAALTTWVIAHRRDPLPSPK